jgi:hypothetical protein
MKYEEQVCKDCHWWKSKDNPLKVFKNITPCSASPCCDEGDPACLGFKPKVKVQR